MGLEVPSLDRVEGGKSISIRGVKCIVANSLFMGCQMGPGTLQRGRQWVEFSIVFHKF